MSFAIKLTAICADCKRDTRLACEPVNVGLWPFCVTCSAPMIVRSEPDPDPWPRVPDAPKLTQAGA